MSIPCQIKCDGSKFAPIISPTASRIFNKVVGLYTQKPGCISNATFFTPYCFTNSTSFCQYGISTSFHCQFKISKKSSGHGQVTQFGYLLPSLSPGQPENVTTVSTSSSFARRTVFSKSSWYIFAISLFGWTALPCVLKTLISRLLSFIIFLISSILSLWPKSSSGLRCALPGQPPAPSSSACTPRPARYSAASFSGIDPNGTVNTPNFIFFDSFQHICK